MASLRIRDALVVGAEIIVSACPACEHKLRKGARGLPKEQRGAIKIVDVTEMVSDAMY